jgi:tRNA-dihydrouridine synthase A
MNYNHPISVAPMMEYTDRHGRYFLRLISKHMLLYTEMVVVDALLHGDAPRHLAYHASEHPIALQLGGSCPDKLAQGAKLAQAAGFDEVNVNVGCPSDRVQSGRFGLCLMKEAAVVAECVAAMKAVVDIPVTVKTRIGVDECDSFDFLCEFMGTVHEAGCDYFSVHARKGWLKGLSPKENRTVPPLDYERVYQLKAQFPTVWMAINGGIETLDDVETVLHKMDGAMVGRAAYHNPYMLAKADQRFYGSEAPVVSRLAVLEAYSNYVTLQRANNVALGSLLKPALGLYQSEPGARHYRRAISEAITAKDTSDTILLNAVKKGIEHEY